MTILSVTWMHQWDQTRYKMCHLHSTTAISKIFWSILDPGPATAEGPTVILQLTVACTRKCEADKCQVHTEVQVRQKMSGNYCVLGHLR